MRNNPALYARGLPRFYFGASEAVWKIAIEEIGSARVDRQCLLPPLNDEQRMADVARAPNILRENRTKPIALEKSREIIALRARQRICDANAMRITIGQPDCRNERLKASFCEASSTRSSTP